MSDAQRIHQVEQQLAACDGAIPPANPHKRIELLNELAWLLSDTDMKRAFVLAESAGAYASAPTDNASTYQTGIAYSLRTQGYLNMRFGNYALGLSQLLRALPLVEALQLEDGLPDVLDGIAGIYCLIGSYPEALDTAYKQLEAAQRVDDPRRIINAYNNLAVIYFETGDHAGSQETLHFNLKIAREIKHTRIECITYINLAEICLAADDHTAAVAHARRGFLMSQEHNYELFAVHALHTLGQCYLKTGEITQALASLEKAVALSQRLDSKTTECLALLTLSEAHRDLQQNDRALTYVQQAIATAAAIDAKKELYQGHLLLAELLEVTGEVAQALAHFKEHQKIKELVFNEKSDERLKVLQVVHETATAKQAAEIAHIRTVELQCEVSEHKQAQAQLQRRLEYMRALSSFKQTLLVATENQEDRQRIVAEALHHLLKPTQARIITVHRNVDDPAVGLHSQMFVAVRDTSNVAFRAANIDSPVVMEYRAFLVQALPSLAAHSEDVVATVFPQSLIPSNVRSQLSNGAWVGGTIEDLFADSPDFRDFLTQKVHLHALLLFPIQIDGQWWGTIVMAEAEMAPSNAVDSSLWTEDEILMLGTATEMIASTLQRWQAETDLHILNNQLEEQIAARTVELSDTVEQLRAEIVERRRAEIALQRMTASLEQRLADRTLELATFFDLTVLGGQSADLPIVLEYALPRILEVTHSRIVCIHLLDEEHKVLLLIAEQELPNRFRPQLQRILLLTQFQEWLGEIHEPLLTTALAQQDVLPKALRLADYQTYLGVQIRVGQQIEGILSCYRLTERGFSLDDIALVTAIGEQIGAVIETHRLRSHAAELAVVAERQRLARDLHDSMTQALYSLSLFGRAGREAAEDGDVSRLQQSLTQIEATTLQILREMRLLLYELRPSDLENEGLKRALELRLSMVERRAGVHVEMKLDASFDLPSKVETELYYIVVEALNNIVKHAAATHVTLVLTKNEQNLYVRVVDDGNGFDAGRPSAGLGLKNIHERVHRLRGTLSISSGLGHGTIVEVVIPH
ncbi:MAG TPA: tetratricopeptide repeat protein [Caldilineaceae bacterium]|nr:tetratricopeptide repeat protein [Caldilineaceae bacterium]